MLKVLGAEGAHDSWLRYYATSGNFEGLSPVEVNVFSIDLIHPAAQWPWD
jgi:hypothetical protein